MDERVAGTPVPVRFMTATTKSDSGVVSITKFDVSLTVPTVVSFTHNTGRSSGIGGIGYAHFDPESGGISTEWPVGTKWLVLL
jgi:transcription elongation GreA/GreB family factor